MLYVTTLSTHFIYGYMASKLISNSLQRHLLNSVKEGNTLFYDALNTFLYMVIWHQILFQTNCLQQHLFNSLKEGRKDGNALFNDAPNTFLFTVIRRQILFQTSCLQQH